MRDSSSWYKELVEDVRKVWPSEDETKPALFFQVELGLRLMQRLNPELDAAGVYTLLGGYPFATAARLTRTPDDHAMVTNARHMLWKLRRRRVWHQALESYLGLPERLRAYRVPTGGGIARYVEPLGIDRLAVYDGALQELPAFDRRPLPLAGPGPSRFIDRRRRTSANIPDTLCLDPTPGHDLSDIRAATRKPLDVPLAELADIAEWMDTTEEDRGRPPGGWTKRLRDLTLDTLTADGRGFQETDTLRLDRLLHLVGMVGAGKSTLMTLIAVWAAKQHMRTTLVVGDVAEQLTLTTLFRGLGIPAAPVLGGTTREQHASRLHRRLAARGLESLLAHDDPGFDHLSTACAIDVLRGMEAAEPLRYSDAPCISLYPEKKEQAPTDGDITVPERYRRAASSQTRSDAPRWRDEAEDGLGPKHGCPIWGGCPRHRTDRDLVDALIWVANPASLLQTSVPAHLNEERLRHLELACLRSDIVIVDEADRVQMTLDSAFAPSATLVTRGPESWLDRLHTQKIDEVSKQGRLPLTEQDVARWTKSLDIVSSATNRLYEMLIVDEALRKWVDIDYFSAWTLQEKLTDEWFPRPGSRVEAAEVTDGAQTEEELYEQDDTSDGDDADRPGEPTEQWAERRAEITRILDDFRDDPLGDDGPYRNDVDDLIRSTHDLLHTVNEKGARERLRAVLDLLLAGSPLLDGRLPQPLIKDDGEPQEADVWGSAAWYARAARRLEFALLLGALQKRLERVTFLWPQVEAALRLDSTDNELSRRPPLDYAPIVPEAPMGNVLGFQYLPYDDEPRTGGDGRRSGTLRFFRCAGVGRELLLNLCSVGADPALERPGPHVMLMSGTSWAGTSTRAHIIAPVRAVLKPNTRALEAVRQTVFRTHFLYDERGAPLTLSGQDQEVRPTALRLMVNRLGRPAGGGLPSPLEQELQLIGDDYRRRALLLVGSYREAVAAADLLNDIARWRGKVRVLVADDAELDDTVSSGVPGPDGLVHAGVVRRGDLASFAEDPDAELLIAPLMAIERGHNILNAQRTAAFGTVLFLARPHPRPDDLSLAVFAINDWVSRFIRDHGDGRTRTGLDEDARTFNELVTKTDTLDEAGLAFRNQARREWRRLLSRRYIYSQLSPAEQTSFAWDQLVAIWQVIGRLVRGGVPARVVFVDAAFAPALAEAGATDLARPVVATASGRQPRRRRRRSDPGLLVKLRDILAPYFDHDADPATFTHPADPALVRMLYQPLYDALCGLHTPQAAAGTPTAIDAKPKESP